MGYLGLIFGAIGFLLVNEPERGIMDRFEAWQRKMRDEALLEN
jgi:hypothetical protein